MKILHFAGISALLIALLLSGCDDGKKSSIPKTCADDTCSGHGTCDDTSGRAVCTCDEGYTSQSCTACIDGYQDNDENGTCEPTCATSGYSCSGHGTCADDTGTPLCACDEGTVQLGPDTCLINGDGSSCESPILIDFATTGTTGDTTGAGNETNSACTDVTAGNDVAYMFVLKGTRSVMFETEGFDTVMYLRSACGDIQTELYCDDDSGPRRASRIEAELPAGTYYLIVDAYGDDGEYTLTWTIDCGDGLIYDPATGECLDDPCEPNLCDEELKRSCIPVLPASYECTCDPGAVVDPENPDACIPNPNQTGESCLDPILMADPAGTLQGDNTTSTGEFTGSCGGDGADRVYTFTVGARSKAHFSAEGYDTVLYLRSACDDAGSELACNDAGSAWEAETLDLILENAGTYYLFVDTYDRTGTFDLSWTIYPDPCADEETVCPGTPVCEAAADWSSHTCACPVGMIAFNNDCVDDPCDPNPCTAPGRTRCVAELPGNHTCGCEVGYIDNGGVCESDPAAAEWAVVVFLNADNNLESFGLEDIDEMSAVGSTADVDIVALVDLDTDTARVHYINAGSTTIVREDGEIDMSDWRVLRDFGVWAVTNYPARHYAFVLWDHGAGWQKSLTSEPAPLFKGFSNDDHGTAGEIRISNGDYARALTAITTEIGRKIDVVSFDACLMGMWEVAEATRPYADVLAASSETMPGTGLPYTAWLTPLTANPSMTATELGTAIANAYYGDATENSTYGITDLGQVDDLAAAVDAFAAALLANPAFYAQVETVRQNTQWFTYEEYIDLTDFASRLVTMSSAPQQVVQTASALLDQLDLAIVHSVAQSGYPGSHGLAIYLPASGGGFDPAYQDTGAVWSTRTAWDDFVADFAN
ncbi:hypothetical protein KJ975_06205 [Myxococcota bacterium]|nr:hypothetical protein [Myxococcota bacterium]